MRIFLFGLVLLVSLQFSSPAIIPLQQAGKIWGGDIWGGDIDDATAAVCDLNGTYSNLNCTQDPNPGITRICARTYRSYTAAGITHRNNPNSFSNCYQTVVIGSNPDGSNIYGSNGCLGQVDPRATTIGC